MADNYTALKSAQKKRYISKETFNSLDLSQIPVGSEYEVVSPIEKGDLSADINNALNKAENALPKPTNDTTGSAGQVLKKTANGSEWGDVAGGTNVVANPSAAGTNTLTKLTVGDTTYNIPSGGGSGPTYSAGNHITIDSNNAINAEWPTAANAGYEGVGSTGTVTGVKMNGEVKGTGGVVDLGTVYVKPTTGIPKTDLASAVQASLTKADSAVQPGSLAIKTAVLDGTTLTLTL